MYQKYFYENFPTSAPPPLLFIPFLHESTLEIFGPLYEVLSPNRQSQGMSHSLTQYSASSDIQPLRGTQIHNPIKEVRRVITHHATVFEKKKSPNKTILPHYFFIKCVTNYSELFTTSTTLGHRLVWIGINFTYLTLDKMRQKYGIQFILLVLKF